MSIPAPPQGDSFLVRPFVGWTNPSHNEIDTAGDDRPVRAYAITRGRSRAPLALGFEAMLRTTAVGAMQQRRVQFESRAVIRMCMDEPLCVVELAARLQLPIGVLRVIAADLVTLGFLDVFVPPIELIDNVDFLAGLIASVRAL